jgi:hypothetical protein
MQDVVVMRLAERRSADCVPQPVSDDPTSPKSWGVGVTGPCPESCGFGTQAQVIRDGGPDRTGRVRSTKLHAETCSGSSNQGIGLSPEVSRVETGVIQRFQTRITALTRCQGADHQAWLVESEPPKYCWRFPRGLAYVTNAGPTSPVEATGEVAHGGICLERPGAMLQGTPSTSTAVEMSAALAIVPFWTRSSTGTLPPVPSLRSKASS